jgi:hypothetical protein
MDWLWPIYEQYVQKLLKTSAAGTSEFKDIFLSTLANSTATLYVMEPIGDTIRFRGLGKWVLPEVPDLLADPNEFIANLCGGGKFKINFHHDLSFVGTHNFRTWGEEKWRTMEELYFD